jgi:F-type H+-transporting ATPase subunit epsilon
VALTRFELVTPSRNLYSGEAEMVVCRTVDGEIAFLANHMPYIGALDTCVVRVVGPSTGGEPTPEAGSAEGEVRVAVRSGFVEVNDNQVIMLADVAQLASDIDLEQARADESSALAAASPQGTPGGEEAEVDSEAEIALKWAQARIEAVQPS